MAHVSTAELADRLEQDGTSYVEVLSEESMRVELARYPNPEPKTPHREDELYVVLSGSGMVHVGTETYGVEEGDVVYVEQGLEHDFFDIDEEITALVVFTDSQESVLDRRE
ncbi:cupin domain-containing protein [Salinirussus salinus]|jgi:mannose-1-phosphate guanylyltransferase|uniref:cupin domain-containing protein n=1 Tax=Salinirussus salinus TaxID=1198300 RepID=UPI0013588DF2|nr:cupin domain-containing protein [Salinirussus salinus]